MDFIQFKTCYSKDTGKQMKKQATDWEKNLQYMHLAKDLTSEHTENLHNSIISKQSNNKWAKNLNRENIQMLNKYMQRYSYMINYKGNANSNHNKMSLQSHYVG